MSTSALFGVANSFANSGTGIDHPRTILRMQNSQFCKLINFVCVDVSYMGYYFEKSLFYALIFKHTFSR